MLKDPPKSIVLHAEGMVQHWRDVVLSGDTGKGYVREFWGGCAGQLADTAQSLSLGFSFVGVGRPPLACDTRGHEA